MGKTIAGKPAKKGKPLSKPASLPQPECEQLVALFNAGRHAELESRARLACERYPDAGFAWKALGASLQIQGKNALAVFQKTTALLPGDAEAHNNLGNALKGLGQLDDAVASYARALEIKPDYADAHYNLGAVLKDHGQLDGAVIHYRRALEINPGYADAHNNLGNALKDLGQLEGAAASYARALAIKPDYADAHNNLGNVLKDLGQLDGVVASYRLALKINPANAETHSNLGVALQELGQLDEAVASYARALEINPGYADAHYNLGNALKDLGQLDGAVASYVRALEIKPDFAEAHNNLGSALQDLGQIDSALASYARALEDKPDYAEAHSNLLFTLNFHPDKSREEIFAVCREYDERFGLPQRGKWQPHDNSRDARRRLRIGYVSPDFRRHAVAYFAEPILANHDKSQVEIFCYAEVKRGDEYTARFRQVADHWYSTVGLSDDAVAQMIREHRIDILVDLAGHTQGNRLPVFARKPAPVQLTYLGYPGSTGLSAMDYRITDRHADPEGSADAFYRERLLRLPDSLCCYRPSADMPEASILPALSRGYLTFGSFNNANKIDPHTLSLWAELLRALPATRLMMLAAPEGETRLRLVRSFAELGIEAQRLEFHGKLPAAEFHRKFLEVDLALDPISVGGATTTCESLWMGVPVIAWAGERFITRVSYSFLTTAGLADFAACSAEGYIRIATHLADNLPLLAEIRAGLRGHIAASPLVDEIGFTRNLESLYREIWGKWCDAGAALPQAECDQLVALFNAGRYAEVEGLARSACERYPDSGFIWMLLGASRQRQGKDGLPALQKVAELLPENAAAHCNLGNALRDRGQLDSALSSYARALEINPDFADAYNNQGLILQDIGQVDGALASYAQALEINPDFAEAHCNLGNALQDLGQLDKAVTSYAQALEINPDLAEAHNNLGNAQRCLGQLVDAAASYARALEIKPDYAEAHYNRGVALQDLGQLDGAVASYNRALEIKPDYVKAYNNLGNVQKSLGQLDSAVASYRCALEIKPDYAEAHGNLGIVLQELGLLDGAAASYAKALEIKPDYVEAHCNLGNVLQDLGQLDGALASLRRALEIKPDYAEAHNNLGVALQELGQVDSAVACYRRALEIKPDFADAHNNLGNALLDLGLHGDALASFRRALEIEPAYAKALSNLGNALKDLGQLDGAMESYHRALEIKPDYAKAHNNLGVALQELGKIDDAVASYRRALELKPDYAVAHSNLLFALNYHPSMCGEEIFSAYREYDQRFGLPYRSKWLPHSNSRDTGRRLKVGYVSPDFRQHSCKYFLEPLLSHHDKSVVEVYAYAELVQEDAVTVRYRGYADHWVPTLGMSDDALSERIRADGIDILVDLAGHTARNRLSVFARKPAPVSLSWLGFGYTTGLTAVDYLLTDVASAPEGSEGLFSETPWRLATPGYAYRPAEGMGQAGSLPALTRGHITFGTLTREVRINQRTIRVWAEILKRVEGARLVIDSSNFQSAAMQDALAEKFAAHGIARERLEIGHHTPPWDVLRSLDIGLDCFPHNSGTTLFETLYMGAPFVTLAGRPSVGRLGSSILEGVGHPEWIARTEGDYVEIAVALASDLAKLAALRGGLRKTMESGPLMDEAGFARKVEAAYREMFETWVRE